MVQTFSRLMLVTSLLTGCFALPSLESRNASVTIRDTVNTRLGRAISPLANAHPGKSGVLTLLDSRDAFAARALLADVAERTLDVQYYIWHDDMSGTLLLESLRRAADRGVRVRFLLDDNNTAGMDTVLAALDAHPNVEVRLFNPFTIRKWRYLNYLTDFSRLNRRMHNKSFTADNQATIIGGRNVGDEYFGASDGILFADLDVIAVGAVVGEVSTDFDRYWASGSAYPVDRILPVVNFEAAAQQALAASLVERDPAAAAYIRALKESPFVRKLLAGSLPFEWALTHLVSDDPAKVLGRAPSESLLMHRLDERLGRPAVELLLVSPYFVPAENGTEWLVGLAKSGVNISVLTNSLEATDVVVVHAGYAKRRETLLASGIALYERKRLTSDPAPERRAFSGSGGSSAAGSRFSNSSSSLHAKTFAVDRSRIFIGSFNFDPRSAKLNTEMGFVIHSPALAQSLAEAFEGRIPENSYALRLPEDGDVQWIEQQVSGSGGAKVIHKSEPGATFGQRILITVLSILPIERML